MSCHVIEYVEGHKKLRAVCSKKEYLRLRDTARQKMLVHEVRNNPNLAKGEMEKKKKGLLQMNYSCIPKEDGNLRGATTPSDTIGMDIDFNPQEPDYEQKMAQVPQKILDKKEQLGLLLLERSVRKGWHIVFRRHFNDGLEEGKLLENQEKNLKWASRLLGVKYDEGAKDITRVFFTTTADKEDLLFVSDDLFSIRRAADATTMVNGHEDSMSDANDSNAPAVDDTTPKDNGKSSPASEAQESQSLLYYGTPYADIVKKYWDIYNDGKTPCEGDRNTKTFELAMALRSICDYSQEMLERVIPRYDGFDEGEWRLTIANALKEPRKGMPYRLNKVLDALKRERKQSLIGGCKRGDSECSAWSVGMPEPPARWPEMIDTLTMKLPASLKPTAAESIWPAACANISDVTFRYCDGTIHEPNISSPLIARQSSGKSCVNKPIEHLLCNITRRDRENELKEEVWREANKVKGASKDKQARPKDIVFQRLDDDLTAAALSQSLIDAERNGHRRIITKVDEIELLKQVGNGKSETVGTLVRYGFDSSRWGQKRVGLDSVNGSYTVRWVWNASCTPRSLKKLITREWVSNGSLGRLNLNTLILPEGYKELERIGDYDQQYADSVRKYADRLEAAKGLIVCKEADELVPEMLAEHNAIADQCESEGYRVFSYRAVIIGWLKANILYIANGMKWEPEIADYVKYSVRRDLWVKFYFFGDDIEEEISNEEVNTNKGPRNLLDSLPEEFTYNDFTQLRISQGKRGDGKGTLRQWVFRGYVAIDDVTGNYLKIKKKRQ